MKQDSPVTSPVPVKSESDLGLLPILESPEPAPEENFIVNPWPADSKGKAEEFLTPEELEELEMTTAPVSTEPGFDVILDDQVLRIPESEIPPETKIRDIPDSDWYPRRAMSKDYDAIVAGNILAMTEGNRRRYMKYMMKPENRQDLALKSYNWWQTWTEREQEFQRIREEKAKAALAEKKRLAGLDREYLDQLYHFLVGRTTAEGTGYVHVFNIGVPGEFYHVRKVYTLRNPSGVIYITNNRRFSRKDHHKIYRLLESSIIYKRPLILIRTMVPTTQRYAYLLRLIT